MTQNGPRDKPSIETLKKRMARDPLSRAFLQLTEAYRKAGRFAEAVQVCQEGLERHPGYHTARIALGRTYLESGDLESARKALTEVLDTMPENHLAGKLLADVQLRLGDRSGAAATYRAVLSHYPDDPEVQSRLDELDKPVEKAPATAARADPPTRSDSGDAPRLNTSLAHQQGAGDPPIADSGRSPDTAAGAEARSPVAPITPLAHQGEKPAGVAAPIVLSDPANDALQTNTLAELYLRQGLEEKALEVYRAMLRVDPGNERARRRLAELSGEPLEGPMTVAPRPVSAASGPESPSPPASATRSPEQKPERSAPPPSAAPGAEVPSGQAGVDGTRHEPPVEIPSVIEKTAVAPAAGNRTRARVARLERWLVTIRTGSGLSLEGMRR